ncbi:MAG TPA: hypothetical protein PLC48_11420 [Ferruginibacter sp.]|nr:hypothetical protein [Ferruginibacter sp.]
MKKYILFPLAILILNNSYAQKADKKINRFADFSAAIGQSQGSLAASYVHNWKIGKKKKWEVGIGARFTTYIGTKTDFITAPARLARTSTTPFLIFFAGQKTENHDTLTVQRPLVNMLNLSANVGYNFNNKWSAGFNIDVIGFSFGRKSSAILTSNGLTRIEPTAKVAPFNILLTGDHDRGSLNSEFFVRYRLKDHWSIRALYQFIFVEYKTSTINQAAPDGTINDRFRNKANTFGMGISYHF